MKKTYNKKVGYSGWKASKIKQGLSIEDLPFWKAIKGKIKKQDNFCHFCRETEGKKVEGIKKENTAVDCDFDDENCAFPIYSEVWMCQEHLTQWQEQEGIFDPFKYAD